MKKYLLDVETHYPEMDKLALALVMDFRKLRPYFHALFVEGLTNYLLHQALQKPKALVRLLKWVIKLSQIEIFYKL